MNNGVDLPTTGFANSPLDTNDLIKMVGGPPLIVKLLEGTQGKGVVMAETKKAAESVINAFKSFVFNTTELFNIINLEENINFICNNTKEMYRKLQTTQIKRPVIIQTKPLQHKEVAL